LDLLVGARASKIYTLECRAIQSMRCRSTNDQTIKHIVSFNHTILRDRRIFLTFHCSVSGKNVQRSCLIHDLYLTFPSSAKSSPIFPNASQDGTIGITHTGAQCLDTSTIICANLGNIDDCPHARCKSISHTLT
jgi:hypothetical protein